MIVGLRVLGSRVKGSGFRVYGVGIRVRGLGVYIPGLRVARDSTSGFGSRVWDSAKVFRFLFRSLEFGAEGAEFRVQEVRSGVYNLDSSGRSQPL